MDTTHVIEAMRAGRRANRHRRPGTPYALSAGTHQGRRVCRLSSFGHDLHATFAPDAAMLGVSLRHRGEELLALPQDLDTYARTGAATGIPLLHPWANRLEGFDYGGRLGFRVLRAGASGDGAWLAAELNYGARPELLAAFPFPHRLTVEIELRSAVLRFRTTLVPVAEPVPIAFRLPPLSAPHGSG